MDILSIHCTEEEIYARRVAAIISGDMSLAADSLVIHSLHYVAFTRAYDTIQILGNVDYCLKEILCDQRFCVRMGSTLLVN